VEFNNTTYTLNNASKFNVHLTKRLQILQDVLR